MGLPSALFAEVAPPTGTSDTLARAVPAPLVALGEGLVGSAAEVLVVVLALVPPLLPPHAASVVTPAAPTAAAAPTVTAWRRVRVLSCSKGKPPVSCSRCRRHWRSPVHYRVVASATRAAGGT